MSRGERIIPFLPRAKSAIRQTICCFAANGNVGPAAAIAGARRAEIRSDSCSLRCARGRRRHSSCTGSRPSILWSRPRPMGGRAQGVSAHFPLFSLVCSFPAHSRGIRSTSSKNRSPGRRVPASFWNDKARPSRATRQRSPNSIARVNARFAGGSASSKVSASPRGQRSSGRSLPNTLTRPWVNAMPAQRSGRRPRA